MTAGNDPAQLLSAYLDGELSDTEVGQVEAWLAEDPDHRRQLDDLGKVRTWVRELPMVEPPPEVRAMLSAPASPFGPVRPRTRRQRAVQAVTAGAVGAVAVASLLVTGGTPAVAQEMDVAEAVDVYEQPSDPWAPPTEAAGAVEDAWSPEQVPEPFRLQAVVLLGGGLIGLRYTDGSTWFSVFEQRGRIAWRDLPASGRRTTVEGDPAWMGTIDGHEVALVERGERVYMVIGQSGSVTRLVSVQMPAGAGPGVLERIGRRCHDTVELLGLRG
jgi:hypothetical protein